MTRTYYCVTTSFDDKGRVVSAITSTVEASRKPKNSFSSTARKDIYIDWFPSLAKAKAYVQEALKA